MEDNDRDDVRCQTVQEVAAANDNDKMSTRLIT